MIQNDNSSPTVRDLLNILFKYKWTIVILTSSAVFIGIIYSELTLPKYTAVSKILIKIGRENITPETGVIKPSSMITMMQPSAIIHSEVELLRGRHIVEQIMATMGDDILNPPRTEPQSVWQKIKRFIKDEVKSLYVSFDRFLSKLGLTEELTPRDKVVLALQKSFVIEPIKDSNSVEIKLSYSNPELAAKLVNTAVSVYLKHRQEIHKTSTDLGFFLEQTENFKKKMEDAEHRLKDFKSKGNISSLEEQRSHLLQLNTDVRSALDETDIELARLKKKFSTAQDIFSEKQLSFSGSDITNPSEVIDSFKLKLMELKLKKIDLSLKYLEDSPFITAVNKEIKDIEEELEKEKIKSAVSIDISAYEVKKESLTRLLNKINSELDKINRQDFGLRDLIRNINENERLYNTYNQKTEEMRISKAMDAANITNIGIIEPAYVPLQSDRLIRYIPQKIFNIFATLIFGIFSSISLIALMEILDHSLKSASDIEKYLALPVLGVISDKKYLTRKTSFFNNKKKR